MNHRTVDTPAPSRQRPLRMLAWVVGGLVLVSTIGALIASSFARSEIAERLATAGHRFGLTLEAARISVPVIGGISLEGVEIRRRDDNRPIATLTRIDTDLSLIGAVFGQRRPGTVDISGLRLLVRWNDGLTDFESPETSDSASAPSSASPIVINLKDSEVGFEVAHTFEEGRISADAVTVRITKATLTRDEHRRFSLTASGTARASDHETDIDVTLDADGSFWASFDKGAQLGLSTPFGPLWLALGGAEFDNDGLRLRGLGLRRSDDVLSLGDLDLGRVPRSLSTLLDELRKPRMISARQLTLARGEERLSIGRMVLDLGEGALPSRIKLAELAGTLSDPLRNLRFQGRVGAIDVGLSPPAALFEALRTRAPLDALSDLHISEPTLEVVLPSRPLDVIEAAPQPDGDPPPILGNDDDLPKTPTPPAPILSPESDWLGALLGSERKNDAPSSLLDLIPEALRARLPKMLARVTALKPRIENATLAVKDASGLVMLTLEDASFSARAHEDTRSVLAFTASVMRDGAEAAHLDLEIDIAADLTLESISGKASGRSLAHQLARFIPRLSVQEDAAIDLSLRYARPHLENAPHHVEGRLAVRNFSFEYWRIADREIRDLEAAVAFDASIDRKHHRILLDLPTIEVGEARLTGSLDLTRKKGARPSFIARLEMARQDCAAVGRSIPRGLIPNLSTLALEGQLDFKASLELDLANPTGLNLEVEGNGDDCRILSLGPGIDPTALRGPYIHHPREPRGILEHISVGPGTDEWVPAEKLPDLVTTAAWVTEDRRWTEHRGVRWDLIERALKMDLDQGRFVYGGSTITQQLVKNIYLTRTKNLARKFEEAIIAWQMERILTKEEIITLYVNCIEYGPEIYGIKQAARIYFDKKVKELDALEIAFIMGLKPYPKAGYNQFKSGQLNEWWIKRVSHVLEFISKFAPHLLAAEDVETFAPYQPKFAQW